MKVIPFYYKQKPRSSEKNEVKILLVSLMSMTPFIMLIPLSYQINIQNIRFICSMFYKSFQFKSLK